MKYGRSPAEKDFKTYATIAIALLFFISLAHTAVKYLRNKNLNWKPNVNATTLPDGIRIPLNLIERELAPSLMVVTFLISVGCFFFFQLFMLLGIIGSAVFLFFKYRKVDQNLIKIGRISLVIITIIMFLSLMIDNHAFEDSTLP